MFNVSSNGIITITRGDTAETVLLVNIGSTAMPIRYDFWTDQDRLYLGIMEPGQSFEEAIIKKVFTKADLDTDHDVIIKFIPEDTEFLEPGRYYYTIKLVRYKDNFGQPVEDPLVDTIVQKTKFIILD